jgi:uncharacterized membrane protein HdeD (DUF308 family)
MIKFDSAKDMQNFHQSITPNVELSVFFHHNISCNEKILPFPFGLSVITAGHSPTFVAWTLAFHPVKWLITNFGCIRIIHGWILSNYHDCTKLVWLVTAAIYLDVLGIDNEANDILN